MVNGELTTIRQQLEAAGPRETLSALVEHFRSTQQFERLFDALMMQARWDLNLPVSSPLGFQGVPDDHRKQLEQRYIDAARTVGNEFLKAGNIPRAWGYFRTIGDFSPVTQALETVDPSAHDYEALDGLIEIALEDGANRVAGLRLLLASHGTCNTVTMADRYLPLMTPEERRETAKLLVNDVYAALQANLAYVVKEQQGIDTDQQSIGALIKENDWLFEGGSYHIDASHLHATVRFSRSLKQSDPELQHAIELSEYGMKLDPQFHYPADVPFDEYYAAHTAFLKAMADIDGEQSFEYFKNRLQQESDSRDRTMTAYVLVDLLTCCHRLSDAAEIAAEHLIEFEDPNGFSFSALCVDANRLDLLQSVAESSNDPIRFTAALIEANRDSGDTHHGTK